MTVLISNKAPDFCLPAVLGNGKVVYQFKLSERIKGRYGLLFFYPLDFTFVCPSELIALDRRIDAFTERQVEVMAISVDSQFTHNAWRETPIDRGGIGSVNYPLIADVGHKACRLYGVEHMLESVAFRASFLIDKNGIIRIQMANDLPIGRNVDEILRLFDALQYHEEYGEVCPAGWQRGEKGMKATPQGVATYLANHADQL